MHLIHLALTNFRTYARLELDLSPGVTLLQGANASGKTSLLESIFYLATARSPHAGVDRELIRWGASDEPLPFARVEAVVEKQGDVRTRLEIVLVQAAEDKREEERGGAQRLPGDAGRPSNRVSKRIKVNGVSRRAIDLLGELNAVLFLPEDLQLVFGSPGERRRYLDTTLSQIDRRYGRALSKYNQIVEQRNSLLRDFRARPFRPSELEVWDRQMIDEGSYLIVRRADAVRRYNQLVQDIHPALTDGAETLSLVYQPSVAIASPAGSEPEAGGAAIPADLAARAQDIAARFERQIHDLRERERAAALTLVGPHRDDVRFFVQSRETPAAPPVDANTYASRGQGRTIALSLKLAEVALMRGETGEDPVLLLDDVMSELDATRRAALAQTVIDAPQALVTATDLGDFEGFLSRARVYSVRDGAVLPHPQAGD